MATEIHYRDLGYGITCIDTLLHRRSLAACYLIEQEGMAGFVDTGTHRSIPVLLEVLRRKNIAPEQVAYIMPTHVHLDHAGAAGGLMGEFPRATLLIHPRGARHMIDPSRLRQGSVAVYGEAAFEQLFGSLQAIAAERVVEVGDGMVLDFNGRPLRFLHTPGHARHHYCIYDELSRGLFTGDTLGVSYPELNRGRARLVFPPSTPTQFDPPVWINTLDKLMALAPAPEKAYITHFGMHEDLPSFVALLRGQIDDYVSLAEDSRGLKTAQREQRISARLLQQTTDYLLDRECGLDPAHIRVLIEFDMRLNAQGLNHWLDSR